MSQHSPTRSHHRHRRPSTARRTTLRGTVLATLVSLLAGLLVAVAAPAQAAPSPVTYQGWQYPATASAPTADKPQSKLWWTDGSWWALMLPATGGGIRIHRLNRTTHTWVDTGVVVDTRENSTGDALWEAGRLYVVSRTATGAVSLSRLSYAASTDQWSVDAGFPSVIASGGTETASIARDSVGRVWATWTQGSRVWVSSSGDDGLTWPAATVLPVPDNSIDPDDLSAIISVDGSVGVMWTDQVDDAVRYARHVDGAPTTSWTMTTVVNGARSTDDHLNLKSFTADPQGRVFAAFKTSYNEAPQVGTDPLVQVAVRDTSGAWTVATAYTVAEGGTRPQIAVDPSAGILHLLVTSPEAGGTVYEKTSPLDNLSFARGQGRPFVTWPGAAINNVTLAKDPVSPTTGLVALAADSTARRYYHAELDLTPATDTTPPSTPTGVTAVLNGADVDVSWSASTDDVGVVDYQVFRDGTLLTTTTGLSIRDTAPPSGGHAYTVVARDAAGNASAPSAPAVVTVPAPVGTVSIRGVSRTTSTTSTTVTVPAPVGTVAGDLLVVSLTTRGAPVLTPPSGWTLLRRDSSATTVQQGVWTRRVAAGDPSSYAFRLSSAQSTVAQAVALINAGSSVSGSGTTGTGTAPVAPAATATGPSMVLGLFGIARTGTITAPSTMTSAGQATATATYSVTASAAHRSVGAAGTVAADTATAPSSTWVGQHVVVPAGSSSPPPPPPPATGPQVRSVGRVTAVAGTTVAVPAPAGVTVGDILVASVSTRGAPTVTAPAGWTLRRTDVVGTTMTQRVWTRRADGTEGSSYSFVLSTAQSAVGQVVAVSGAADTAVVSGTTGLGTTITTLPGTLGRAGLVLPLVGASRATSLGMPASLTDQGQASAVATYSVSAGAASASLPAGAVPSYSVSTASATWVAQTALLEAPA